MSRMFVRDYVFPSTSGSGAKLTVPVRLPECVCMSRRAQSNSVCAHCHGAIPLEGEARAS